MRASRPLAALAVLASVSLLAACGDDDSSASGGGDGVACDYPSDGRSPAREVEPPPAEATVTGEVPMTLETSIGALKLTLDADAAPCTVSSIVSLAEQGYYDDTFCHRLTTQPGFGVLQCGDPTGTGGGGPGYTIPDELEQTSTYPAGTLAMANTGQPDSGGGQFFICYTDTQLPPQYTAFGTVDQAGIEAVTEAAAAGVQGGGGDGPPVTPVEISKAVVD